MTTLINDICNRQPGASCSRPFGETTEVWKVGGKIFAAITFDGTKVAVKTPSVEDSQLLIEMQRGDKAPYFHRSWIRISSETIPAEEIQDRIETSYRIIRATLTKRAQAELG